MRRPLLLLAALLAGCSSLPPAPRPAPRAVLDAHVRGLHALTFSPDGAMFASAGGGAADPAVDEITLWETATGARRMTFANYKGVVSSLAFSPDGKLLAVGDVQGRIALLEVDSGGERISFQAREGILICLSFTFDGSAIVSVVHSADEAETVEICRWDVTRGVPRETWQSQATTPLALSPDAGVLCWPEPGIGRRGPSMRAGA
ncbi:MAG: hypothetical protein HY293_18180 [Planctomycetes bacterium]|nr:hypothetical protein [Planctomycetota bacterium]